MTETWKEHMARMQDKYGGLSNHLSSMAFTSKPKGTMKRETKLPEGYWAHFYFERFSRGEARAARDQLRSEAFPPATAGSEAFNTCTLYALGYLRPSTMSRWGGRTKCEIVDANGMPVAFGRADCSLLDRFDADLGAMIALGRAVKELRAIL